MDPGAVFDNRDFVCLQVLQTYSHKHIVMIRSANDPSVPEHPQYTRGHMWACNYVLTHRSPESCIVDHVYAADLDGMIAQMLCREVVSRRLNGLRSIGMKFADP